MSPQIFLPFFKWLLKNILKAHYSLKKRTFMHLLNHIGPNLNSFINRNHSIGIEKRIGLRRPHAKHNCALQKVLFISICALMLSIL